MCRIPILWYLQRIRERMGLGLKADFDDFHRTDDSDGFGCSGSQSRYIENGVTTRYQRSQKGINAHL